MKKRYGRAAAAWEAVMILATLIYAFPLYTAVSSAFKSERQLDKSPLGLPSPIHFDTFSQAWRSADIGQAFLSTAIITVASVLGLVLFGSLAGYVIARRQQRMSTVAYYGFLVGLLLPPLLTLIPLYNMIRDAGLLGTYWSLIFVYIGGQMPFTVFLFAGFIRSLSPVYEEAAMVDGAPPWRIYTRIVFPLIRPIVGTVMILNSAFIWNDFLNPLLYLTGSGKQTLAISIYSFVGIYTQQWNLIFAGAVLAALPMIGIFLLLQRSFLKSFAGVLTGSA
jgi:raffinose/stachyose/melibiose transport system permease protein